MSFVRAATVAAIADALGAPPLSADAAASLAPHADVRLREVVQDALKAARACKRATLTRQDIDAALAARGEQPLLGWAASRDTARFARAAGHADLFYVDDPEVGFDEVNKILILNGLIETATTVAIVRSFGPLHSHPFISLPPPTKPPPQIIDKPLPPPPLEVSIVAHWLAVNGVQPATPENAPLPRPRGRAARGVPAPAAAADGGEEGGDALDDEELVGPSRQQRDGMQQKSKMEEAAAAAAAKGKAAAAAAAAASKEKAKGGGGEGGAAAKDDNDGGDGGGDGGQEAGEAGTAAASPAAADADALADAATTAGDLLFSSSRDAGGIGGSAGIFVKAPVRHALSEELAAYLEKVATSLLPGVSGALPLPPTVFSTRGPPAVAAAAAAAAAGGPAGVGSRGAAGQVEAAASANDFAFSESARARARASSAMLSAVLSSLSADPGLHQLAPYLVKLIADGVRSSLEDTAALCRLCRAAGAISSNPGIMLGPYLHRLLPPLMTCLVARKLGRRRRAAGGFGGGARTRAQKKQRLTRAQSQAAALAQAANEMNDGDASAAAPAAAAAAAAATATALFNSADTTATDAGFVSPDDHWAVRDAAADALARVVANYGRAAENVPARVAKALLATLADGGMPLASHYGAVVGLAALGSRGVRGILLPALGGYAAVFEAAAARADRGVAERAKAEEQRQQLLRDNPEKPPPAPAAAALSAAAAPAVADVERVRGAILRVARGALYGGRGVPASLTFAAARPAVLVGARVEGVDNGASAAATKAKQPARGAAAATTPQGAKAAAAAAAATTTTPASSGGKGKKGSATKGGKALVAASKKGGGVKRTRSGGGTTKTSLQTTRKSGRTTRGSSPSKSGGGGGVGGARRSRGATPASGEEGEEESEEKEGSSGDEEEEDDEEEEEGGATSDENEDDEAAAALRRERRQRASAVLSAAWREGAADEQIVRALHELFGEASAPAAAVAAGMTLAPL